MNPSLSGFRYGTQLKRVEEDVISKLDRDDIKKRVRIVLITEKVEVAACRLKKITRLRCKDITMTIQYCDTF